MMSDTALTNTSYAVFSMTYSKVGIYCMYTVQDSWDGLYSVQHTLHNMHVTKIGQNVNYTNHGQHVSITLHEAS